jgi:hypothetical protein
MNSERKKLILAIVLLAAAVGIGVKFWPSGAPLPNSVSFVCVATGQRFSIARDKIPSLLPAKNPRTGAMTLLPVLEQDGKVIVNPRHASCLRDPELAKVNKYVDLQTLEVLKSPRQ